MKKYYDYLKKKKYNITYIEFNQVTNIFYKSLDKNITTNEMQTTNSVKFKRHSSTTKPIAVPRNANVGKYLIQYSLI